MTTVTAMACSANGLGLKNGHGLALFAGIENPSAQFSGNQCPTRNHRENRKRHRVRSGSGMRWSQMWSWGRKEVVSRAQGCQDISFMLLGVQERQDEWNALLREQCGFQERIASCLERIEARMGGSDLDSTLRE